MADPGRANLLRPMPLRLQLYRWQSRVRSPPAQPAVWTQYLAAGRQRYSSTLYVTLRPSPPPGQLTVKFPYRPMAPHHNEVGRLDFAQLQSLTAATRDTATAPGPGGAATKSASASRTAAASGGAPVPTARAGGPCMLTQGF